MGRGKDVRAEREPRMQASQRLGAAGSTSVCRERHKSWRRRKTIQPNGRRATHASRPDFPTLQDCSTPDPRDSRRERRDPLPTRTRPVHQSQSQKSTAGLQVDVSLCGVSVTPASKRRRRLQQKTHCATPRPPPPREGEGNQ